MVTIEEETVEDLNNGPAIDYLVYDGINYVGYLSNNNGIGPELNFISSWCITDQIRILQEVKKLLETDQWKKLNF